MRTRTTANIGARPLGTESNRKARLEEIQIKTDLLEHKHRLESDRLDDVRLQKARAIVSGYAFLISHHAASAAWCCCFYCVRVR
jgi:hypothetical protein